MLSYRLDDDTQPIQEPINAGAEKERNFSRYVERVEQVNANKFFTDIKDSSFECKFEKILNGMLAVLSDDMDRDPVTKEKFAGLLKKNAIRRMAEVGPLDYNNSLLVPLQGVLAEGDCKAIMIGQIPNHDEWKFEEAGFAVIDKEAGELSADKLDLDFVVAHNVFSIGGQINSYRTLEGQEEFVNMLSGSVLDLVRQLSDNPHAAIVLTETYDLMPLDREAISAEADIIAWEAIPTMNGHNFRLEDDGYESLRMRQAFCQAPNFVVLRKKRSI